MLVLKLKKFMLMVIGGGLFIGNATAASELSPREAMEKSLQISLKSSYQSVIPAPKEAIEAFKDPTAKYKVYYYAPENGSVLERRDLMVKDKTVGSFIVNQEGSYLIVYPPNVKPVTLKLNGKLPKHNPTKTWQGPFQLIKKDLQDESCQYQYAGDASYQGIPCKKIVVTLPFPDDEDLAKRVKLSLEEVKKEKKSLESKFSVRRVYLIGAQNLFLYQCTCYNKDGEETFSAEWGQAQFNAVLPKDLFIIPKGRYVEYGDDVNYALLEEFFL